MCVNGYVRILKCGSSGEVLANDERIRELHERAAASSKAMSSLANRHSAAGNLSSQARSCPARCTARCTASCTARCTARCTASYTASWKASCKACCTASCTASCKADGGATELVDPPDDGSVRACRR